MNTRSQDSLPASKGVVNPVKQQQRHIAKQLQLLGAMFYDLGLPETRCLPLLIHVDEHITGIVYGRYKDLDRAVTGRGALVATDKRVLFVDKKPLFIRCDEIPYKNISGITYSRVGPAGTIVLFTKIGTFTIRTFNKNCAHGLVEAIEAAIHKEQMKEAKEQIL